MTNPACRSNIPARTQKNMLKYAEICKKYVEIPLSGREEQHSYVYEYCKIKPE